MVYFVLYMNEKKNCTVGTGHPVSVDMAEIIISLSKYGGYYFPMEVEYED